MEQLVFSSDGVDEVDFYLEQMKERFKKINFEEYYLSYSGGRDSHLIYWFIKEILKDDKIEIVGCNTYMEHTEIIRRIEKYSDTMLRATMKPFDIKEKYGIPCFSKQQDFFIYYWQNSKRKGKKPGKTIEERVMGTHKSWHNVSKTARELLLSGNLHPTTHLCCKYLKKEAFQIFEKQTGKKPILGIRGAESKLRQAQYHQCLAKDGTFTPLHDLDDELIIKIYKKYNIETPEIYKYVSRSGCLGCPYGSYKKEIETDLSIATPAQRKFVIRLFKESYDVLGINYQQFMDEEGNII